MRSHALDPMAADAASGSPSSAVPTQTLTFRPRIALADESLRPTRAEIDLDAIAHNLGVLRRLAAPAKVLAVVKADAYGHGVVPVARRLEADGVDGFGVALAEEGLELREAGVRAPILVLNGVYGGAHADVLEAGLWPVVYDLAQIEAFDRAAPDRRYRVHVKIDTGMARLGVPMRQLDAFLDGLARHPRCVVAGVMTHLSSADTDREATFEQLARFDRALDAIRAAGHRPELVHASNTAATLGEPAGRYDMVRPGGALYGISFGLAEGASLRPALRLRTEVIALRELEPGDPVGYDRTYRCVRRTRVATVPVGYGDGLPRELSNRGVMLLRGMRCPIVGRVSMDLTMLDVTDVEGAAIGDEVVVLGEQRTATGTYARIDADEVARTAGTIAYDVLTSVSRRVPRSY
ncbi:MAG: alanine racemase [Sandaracinaceae bacterium]